MNLSKYKMDRGNYGQGCKRQIEKENTHREEKEKRNLTKENKKTKW